MKFISYTPWEIVDCNHMITPSCAIQVSVNLMELKRNVSIIFSFPVYTR